MKEYFAKLIDVKTIVTFALVGTVVYLGATGALDTDKVYTMAMMVIAFYFGKRDESLSSSPKL